MGSPWALVPPKGSGPLYQSGLAGAGWFSLFTAPRLVRDDVAVKVATWHCAARTAQQAQVCVKAHRRKLTAVSQETWSKKTLPLLRQVRLLVHASSGRRTIHNTAQSCWRHSTPALSRVSAESRERTYKATVPPKQAPPILPPLGTSCERIKRQLRLEKGKASNHWQSRASAPSFSSTGPDGPGG